MGHKTGIERALEKFDGSPTKLAAATDGKVLRQHIEHWLKTGRVPVEKCPAIAAASGVTCDALNPDFDWDFVRANLAQEPAAPVPPTPDATESIAEGQGAHV